MFTHVIPGLIVIRCPGPRCHKPSHVTAELSWLWPQILFLLLSHFPCVKLPVSDDIIKLYFANMNNYVLDIRHARLFQERYYSSDDSMPIRCFCKKRAIIRMKINVASGLSWSRGKNREQVPEQNKHIHCSQWQPSPSPELISFMEIKRGNSKQKCRLSFCGFTGII